MLGLKKLVLKLIGLDYNSRNVQIAIYPTDATHVPPVSTIPVEMLLEIFRHCVCDGHRPGRGLIICSHVCRYWRAVALENPALWSASIDIIHDSPSWTEAKLSRSRNSPLNIKLFLSEPLFPIGTIRGKRAVLNMFRIIAKYNRIQSFSLDADSALLQQVMPLFMKPSAKLENFCI
ncbi:hypothetical protein BJ138DRAFT_1231378, partial [Hygrophoropsis aurantiaca]